MQDELLKKMRYKDGPAAVLNAPDGFDSRIEGQDSVSVTGQAAAAANELAASDSPIGAPSETQRFNFALLYVRDSAELGQWLHNTVQSIADDAVFWIAYPKQSSKTKSDLNRDILARLVNEATPYRPVSNIAIDDTWSALRFRHQDKVKSTK